MPGLELIWMKPLSQHLNLKLQSPCSCIVSESAAKYSHSSGVVVPSGENVISTRTTASERLHFPSKKKKVDNFNSLLIGCFWDRQGILRMPHYMRSVPEFINPSVSPRLAVICSLIKRAFLPSGVSKEINSVLLFPSNSLTITSILLLSHLFSFAPD